MPILKDLREADFLPTYQSLPPTVQEKICLIEVLYERAMLFLRAREKAPAGVPDFDSHLRDLYKNTAKIAQEDHEDEPKVDTWGAYYLGLDVNGWIKALGDSRYGPSPDLVHLAMVLGALWLYWITWPNRRRIFDKKKKKNLSNILEPVAPPSAPSFEATLDRNLVWVAFMLGNAETNIRHWGKKKETMAKKNLRKKEDAIVKKAIVSKIYNISSDIKVGMCKDAVAKAIKAVFKNRKEEISKDIDLPSHYQIKRYLEDDPTIWRDFKQVGRRWIKQT
jgi:hypothetical protein